MINENELKGKTKTEVLKLLGTPFKGAITNVWTYKKGSSNELEAEITVYFDPENGKVLLTDCETV
ncbi:hypothetical protein [Cellulophaga lytica]|uniref:Lipoprotein SmpA/OmlA domain-containing protein n=1 Tax=Cellulophaga lytica (strain ATCC 23178 / DSM 7489 / JCM 8516 / NBRC 14961 / NCIMB 1423 / VKM B-1433 / Cy l20) TaxID=867900 RepID=F0RGE2_CELLC|nr:hypothetical protein [Cellulophaga lytica]ADY30133.1 hypothetical protein Celly_2313 [Cellulophaga lytica DSM 7489]WQG75705.1 hypothetical protein SR888_08375 [Cellulophaga lytica]SNQ43297.1 conserved hypothetical protein [Cellulophaga lytica]